MASTVITAASLAELEKAFAASVSRAKVVGPMAPVLVLTGSNLQHLYLRRLLARELGAVANVRFLTLLDLAGELLVATDRSPGSFLPEGADAFLMQELLSSSSSNNTLTPGGVGMAQAVGATIQDLREAGVTPTDVTSALQGAQAQELAVLLREHKTATERLWDRTKLLELAVSVPPDDIDRSLPPAPLLVYGISDLNDLQCTVLRQVADVRDTRVHLLWADGEPAMGASGRLLHSLTGLGFDHQVLQGPRPQLDIGLVSAPDPQAEVEEAVRGVLDAIEGGAAPADIAVLHRRDASHDELIESVLTRADLSCYVAAGRAVRRSAPGKIALRLNEVLFEEPTRASMLELVTSPGLSLAWIDPDLSPKPVVWERLSKTVGLVKGWESFVEFLQRERDAYDPDKAQDDRDWRFRNIDELLRVVSALMEQAGQAASCSSWGELAAWWTQLFQRLVDQSSSLEAVTSIVARVQSLALLDSGGVAPTLDRFRNALDDAIRRTVMRGGYFQRDGVFVGTAQSARGLRFSHVFLLDCAERVFPPVVRQDPLLRDDERQRINQHLGRSALALKSERVEEERMLFELVQQAATDKLTVSYSRRSSMTGPPRFPSGLLLEELAARKGRYQGIGEIERERPTWFRRLPTRISFHAESDEESTRALDAFDLRVHALERGHSEALPAIEILWGGMGRLLRYRAGREESRFTEFDGVVPEELIARLQLFDRDLSATGLAAYAACPYRFFLRSVLNVRAEEEPEKELQINPLERGSLVHRVLERFVEPSVAGHVSWQELLREPVDRVRELFDDEVSKLPHGVAGLAATWQRERDALERNVIAYLERERLRAEEGWSPVGNEHGFERVEIDLGRRKLFFRGAIDRLDRNGNQLRVVDYKTGWPNETAEGYRTGESLQLPLYIHAAAAAEGAKVEDVVAEYHFVGPRGDGRTVSLRGEVLSGDRRFQEMMRSMVEGIEGGRFFTWPGQELGNRMNNCTYCDYNLICHGNVSSIARRKQQGSDQITRSWREMRGEQ